MQSSSSHPISFPQQNVVAPRFSTPVSTAKTAPTIPSSPSGLAQLLGIVRRHTFVVLGVATAYFGYAAWQIVNQPNQYQGRFQILIEPVNAENASLADPASVGQRPAALDYPTQIAILKSPELLNPVIEELQPRFTNLNYGSLASQIEIQQLNKTKLLQVKYASSNAAQTQAVLDALGEKYLDYSLTERQTYLRQGLQFINNQIDTLSTQLNRIQDQLEAFQRENSFIDPESSSSQLTENLSGLSQAEQGLEQELLALRSQSNILQQENGRQVLLEQDDSYQQLLSQIEAIDAQIATELARFKPENPAIKSLEQQRDNLLPLLEEKARQYLDVRQAEIDIQAQSLQDRLQFIESTQAEVRSQLDTLPALKRVYANLRKELEITDNSLNSFLETRQSLQIEAAQQEIPWELVSEPDTVPIASNTTQDLIQALLVGLAAGLAVAFALDKLDNTYHTTEEIKAKVNLPILGVLPFNQQLFLDEGHGLTQKKRKRKLLSRLRATAIKASAKVSKSMSSVALALLDEYDSSAEFVEALRVMHINLKVGRNEHRDEQLTKAITISSAAPGDGKSTLALNWAMTAVSMNQRVLLIDAVLRDPQLHRVLNLPNSVGLSNLLNENLELVDGIQQVQPDGKLYAVTAGSATVENPAALLSSPKMQSLLSYYKKIFDLVIIDAPTASGLADAIVINRYTDGLILVVRLDQTNKKLLQDTIENFYNQKTNVLGMVVNGHKGHNLALREVTSGQTFDPESSPALVSEDGNTSNGTVAAQPIGHSV